MKLSNKVRYGVQALVHIAFHHEGRPTQTREISEREGIPLRFLEQIFQDLKRARLVRAKRGPKGGYALARPAREIRVGDVIRAVEGPLKLGGTRGTPAKGGSVGPVVTEALEQLSEQVESCFDALTVETLCTMGRERGLTSGTPRSYVYVI